MFTNQLQMEKEHNIPEIIQEEKIIEIKTDNTEKEVIKQNDTKCEYDDWFGDFPIH